MRDRLGRCKNFLWLPSSVQFKGSVDDCKLLFHIEKNDFQRGFDLKLKASCRQCSRRLNSEEHASIRARHCSPKSWTFSPGLHFIASFNAMLATIASALLVAPNSFAPSPLPNSPMARAYATGLSTCWTAAIWLGSACTSSIRRVASSSFVPIQHERPSLVFFSRRSLRFNT